MSSSEAEKIPLQDRLHDEQPVNRSMSALPSNNDPQGPLSGSTRGAAGRGGAHPSPSAGDKTFFLYLQDNRGRRMDPPECRAEPYRGRYMDPSPSPPRVESKHVCVNFEDTPVFEVAKDYYQKARQGNTTSAKAVNALTFILLVVPLLPLTIFFVLFWTFPVLLMGIVLSRKEIFKNAFPLYTLALNASIWIIFVPWTKLAGQGGVAAFILPSLSPGFRHVQAEEEQKGEKLINKRKAAQLKLEAQLARASKEEEEALYELDQITIEHSPKEWRPAFDSWRDAEKNRKFTENRLREVKQEIKEIRNVAKTEACMKLTGYRGIADWAKDAGDTYDNLINAMTAVCALGAGLSYGAATSAQRGNVAYMSYSFAFFIIGLTLTTTAQALLTWCSRLHNYPFTTPYVWEITVGVGVYGAVASVIVGILWLLISIQVLDYPMGTFSRGGDAPLVFNLPPQPAIYATYGLFGAAIFVAFMVFILFGSANGFKTLFWRRSEERKRVAKDAKRLDDYNPTPAVPSPVDSNAPHQP